MTPKLYLNLVLPIKEVAEQLKIHLSLDSDLDALRETRGILFNSHPHLCPYHDQVSMECK